jgi:hypothetical protein
MKAAWPTAHLVHLPVHASWLNQVEIVFSVIQRKVIKPADFADLDELAARLTAFEPRYNNTARAFGWRFTRTDLNDLLRRLDAHRPACPVDPAASETLRHGYSACLDQGQPGPATVAAGT